MSLTLSMAYSLDKDPDLFGQSYGDPGSGNDFLDQYLTFETEDSSIIPVLPESTLLAKTITGSLSAGTSSLHDEDGQEGIESLPQDNDFDFGFAQNQPSPQRTPSRGIDNNLYTEGSGRAAISDTELLSLEGITLQSPQVPHALSPSLPSTPTPHSAAKAKGSLKVRRSRIVRSITNVFNKPPKDSEERQRSPIRKPTSPAKMMRAQQYNEQNMQEWQHRFAAEASKFDFGFQQHTGQISPPPSARVSDASEPNNGVITSAEHRNGAFAWDHPIPQYANRASAEIHTPLTTPPSDVHTFAPHMQQGEQMMHPHGPPQGHPGPYWSQPNMPEEFKDFNQYVSSSAYVEDNEHAPVWWAHATAPISQPSPAVFHRNPGPHNTKSLAVQLQNELAYNANELAMSSSSMPNGLMIQMPHSPNSQQQSYVVAQPSPLAHHQAPNYFSSQHAHPHHPMQNSPHHRYSNSQPLPPRQFAPATIRKTRSRTESDSPSPTSTSANTTPRTPSFHVKKHRSASRKGGVASEPTTPKTPKSGSGIGNGGGLSVDFVNFTPSDSAKILTGVAPSGSSKTKARREKEAYEKRRRLSQAAVRAVQAAGGSIEALVEEGLFV